MYFDSKRIVYSQVVPLVSTPKCAEVVWPKALAYPTVGFGLVPLKVGNTSKHPTRRFERFLPSVRNSAMLVRRPYRPRLAGQEY